MPSAGAKTFLHRPFFAGGTHITVDLFAAPPYAGGRRARRNAMKPTNYLGQATIALLPVLFVTGFLLVVSNAVGASHLVFAYLAPTLLVAMICEPTIAILAPLASSLSAAYFFYAPKFSFYVADPRQVAELVAFTVFCGAGKLRGRYRVESALDSAVSAWLRRSSGDKCLKNGAS